MSPSSLPSFCLPALDASVAGALMEKVRSIVVIGGGGWMGQAALHMIAGSGVSCIGASKSNPAPLPVHVFGSSMRSMPLVTGDTVAVRPLAALADLVVEAPLVLHFAFLTKDKVAGLSPEDYKVRNAAIADTVADWLGRVSPAGFVLPSSGAVYRVIEGGAGADLYGTLKLRDEDRFAALSQSRGFPAVIGRVFNLSGPFMNKLSLYALGSILSAILDGRAVEVRASHRVVRAYTHVADALNLMIAAALQPTSEGAVCRFDVVGTEPVEVGDLAHRAAALLGSPETVIGRPDLIPGPEDRYLGNPDAMLSLAAQYGIRLRPLDEQILDTAAALAAGLSGMG